MRVYKKIFFKNKIFFFFFKKTFLKNLFLLNLIFALDLDFLGTATSKINLNIRKIFLKNHAIFLRSYAMFLNAHTMFFL